MLCLSLCQYPHSRCWTHVCGSLATLMSLHCFSCDINVRPTGLSPGRFHWRCGPQGGVTLIQLQGLPILGPADEEQWGVGADRAPDHPPHAYGQGGLRRHHCHLRWVWWGKQWQAVGQELGLAQGEGAGLGWEPGEAYRAQ